MDKDRIKEFFVKHVEKVVLGLVGAFVLLLIYQGVTQEHYDDMTPEELKTQAQQVRVQIDEDHTENFVAERRQKTVEFDIVQRTERSKTAVNDLPYKLENTWVRTSVDSSIRRTDPTLVPPKELMAQGVAAILARRDPRSGEYPLTELEGADELEKIEKKKKRVSKRDQRRAMMMSGGGDYGDGYGMESEMEDYSTASTSTGANRKFPSAANFGANPQATTNVKDDSITEQPVPATVAFISGTGIMPHAEMHKAYKSSLKDATGYNPLRDQPKYMDYEVQRADVTDRSVDELTDEDWITITNFLNTATLYGTSWSGIAPEPVPEEFRNTFLTTWLPPVLLDDYRFFGMHPKIPLKFEEGEAELSLEEKLKLIEEMELKLKTAGSSIGGGGDYDDMEEGYGDGGYGGYGYAMIEEDPVDYKLIRFFDFQNPRKPKTSPQPGHKYVYRIRVAVEDPNFPAVDSSIPELKTMSPDVFARVSPLIPEAMKLQGPLNDTRRQELSKIWTDWSEPTAPVSLPDLADTYVGPVTEVRTQTFQIGGRSVEMPRDLPKVKMVTRGIHAGYNGFVPMWIDATEGTVLAEESDAGEIVDPITLEVKKLPEGQKAVINTQSTVIGIQGGEALSIVKDDEMVRPSAVLLFDGDGKLRVGSEIGDQEAYRAWSFMDDREAE